MVSLDRGYYFQKKTIALFLLLMMIFSSSFIHENLRLPSKNNSSVEISPIQKEITSTTTSNNYYPSKNSVNYSLVTAFDKNYFDRTNDIEIVNESLFAVDSRKLYVMNISSPTTTLTIISEIAYDNFGEPVQIFLEGDFAFIIIFDPTDFRGYFCVDVYNITNPECLELKARLYHHFFQYIDIENNLLYLTDSESNLFVYNFTTNHTFDLVASVDLSSDISISKLKVNFDYLFILDYRDSVLIYDIADLNNIELLKEFDGITSPRNFIIVESVIYIINSNSLNVYNLTDISTFNLLYVYDLSFISNYWYNTEYLIFNDILVLSRLNYELHIFDISNIAHPIHRAEIDCYNAFDDRFCDLASSNNLLFLSTRYSGYQIFNCSNPASPTLLTQSKKKNAHGVLLGEGFSIVAEYRGTINFYNISNPFNITKIAKFEFSDDYFRKFSLVGNYCYLLTSEEFIIINCTNPNTPASISSISLVFTPKYLEIEGDIAFINYYDSYDGFDYILIYNLTNPAAPSLIKSIQLNPYIREISVYSNLLAVTTSDQITIFNITNLQSISVISTISDLGFSFQKISIEENILIASTGSYGFQVYDISNPSNPHFIYCLCSTYIKKFYISYCDEIICFDSDFYIDTISLKSKITYLNINLYPEEFAIFLNLTDLSDIVLVSEIHLDDSYNIIDVDSNNDLVCFLDYGARFLLFGIDSDGDSLSDYLESFYYCLDKDDYDFDDDLMADGFEVEFNLDPKNSSDYSLDYDSDGLSNLDEFLYQTNPLTPQSDLDLISDYEEIYNTTSNPSLFDTDADFLYDDLEINWLNSDPNSNDTDADTLDDWIEFSVTQTNISNPDTDFDLIFDGYEYNNNLDPLDSSDSLLDLDLDGLSNYEEFLLGTKACDSDSDNDLFTDYIEVQEGTDPLDPDDFPDISTNTPLPYPSNKLPVTNSFVIAIISSIFLIIITKRKEKKYYER